MRRNRLLRYRELPSTNLEVVTLLSDRSLEVTWIASTRSSECSKSAGRLAGRQIGEKIYV